MSCDFVVQPPPVSCIELPAQFVLDPTDRLIKLALLITIGQ